MAQFVRVTVSPPYTARALKYLLRSDGPIANDILRRGKRVEGRAKQLVNVDTGQLRASIHTTSFQRNGIPVARIGTPLMHGKFIHNGTRPHGPVHAKTLAWRGPDGRWIFAKRVRGIRANPFLVDALPAAG